MSKEAVQQELLPDSIPGEVNQETEVSHETSDVVSTESPEVVEKAEKVKLDEPFSENQQAKVNELIAKNTGRHAAKEGRGEEETERLRLENEELAKHQIVHTRPKIPEAVDQYSENYVA